ncbi:MAG: hypothetical protein HQK53_04305, partial [Oligoflexia bacterium]|nr:hypothetical protein [Oligoflexia bacterium]
PFAQLHPTGLISAGDANTQLTWMDAQVNGRPVTPRHGYAVEINALWYNAIKFYLQLVDMAAKVPGASTLYRNNDSSIKSEIVPKLKQLVAVLPKNFFDKFWDPKYGYLADVVNDQGADFSLRPNQIFALSLPFSILEDYKKSSEMRSIIKHVKDFLITPFGIRTLSPKDPRYCRHYQGGVSDRDGGYHQGTVWPWPIAHFIEAYIKVASTHEVATAYLEKYFEPLFIEHIKAYGLGQIAEIFDGDHPHQPNGCIAQAWSVGEVIRGYELIKKNKEVALASVKKTNNKKTGDKNKKVDNKKETKKVLPIKSLVKSPKKTQSRSKKKKESNKKINATKSRGRSK